MSEPFKPGDLQEVVRQYLQYGSSDGDWSTRRALRMQMAELLDQPSVPMSKIREVLCGMRATEQLQIRRQVIEAVYRKLTGEVM